eukprot:TRINITY_DN3291_c0_g3_i1.p1 TRINITY_DN3291_c0_g3~~TRINITY_DN3291_c0_g3_i1.p1  ORF type:complete len:408 (+),score=68.83 TRINITY_DN3291_c0_g3_i1:26-1225(+)
MARTSGPVAGPAHGTSNGSGAKGMHRPDRKRISSGVADSFGCAGTSDQEGTAGGAGGGRGPSGNGVAMQVLYDAHRIPSRDKSLAEWMETHPRLAEALQDCSSRFVLNLPEETLREAPRLCFELQEAFWFYNDHMYEVAKHELPRLHQSVFIRLMLEASRVLNSIYGSHQAREQVIQEWKNYYKDVPLRGAIVLNRRLDKCLMVQPWKSDKWTFPKGKINQHETEIACAAREVKEETGVDIDGQVDSQHFVEASLPGREGSVKLYIVADIEQEVPVAPTTRREISKIAWVQLADLPGWLHGNPKGSLRFQNVDPFVPELHRWVASRLIIRTCGVGGAPSSALPTASTASNPFLNATAKANAVLASTGAAKAEPEQISYFSIDGASVAMKFDEGWTSGFQ